MLHLAVFALALAGGGSPGTSDLRALELELEAARTQRFYLVIDVPADTLSLRLGGVNLKSYALASLASARRLLARAPDDALARLLECRAAFARELPVIRPGAPILDEATAVERRPRRLLVDCGEDLSLVLTGEARSVRDGIRGSGEPRASVRVRAVLAGEDVLELDDVLPDNVLLLFVLR